VNTNTSNTPRSLIIGLAMVGGLGLTLMVIALGLGVVGGENADSYSIGLFFITGLALLIVGIASWFAVTRPDQHFDDINVPQYTGHHHEEHHDDHAHEIVVHDAGELHPRA
jgi:ABC-type nickel/cobalt efflux system permease component RcnA